MAIPASNIVSIIPRVIPGRSTDLELNGLLLSESDLISADTLLLAFPSAQSVGEYFGRDSTEFFSADIYFAGFNNKQAAPGEYLIARRIAEDAPAWLRSAPVTQTVAQLKTVTDGAMVIMVNGNMFTVDSVDLSAAESYSQIATILQAAIAGVTVTYSSLNRAFTITSNTTGPDSTIGYAGAGTGGTDLAGLLGLTEAAGAVLSQGAAAMSINDQMSAIGARSQNWVTFTTAWEPEPQEALGWAAWANANYGYVYSAYSSSPLMVSADSSADTASMILAAGYDNTIVTYGGLAYSAFVQGAVASIAWERPNGAITLAFKAQGGLAALVTDEAEAAVLRNKRANYMGNFATRNAQFIFYYEGLLSASNYNYLDALVNSIWLNNRFQVAVMDGLRTVHRLPYSTAGYATIQAWLTAPANDAVNNGVIDVNVSLSERQKTELFNEAGVDISSVLMSDGYFIQILDPGPDARAARNTPIISIWYTYGGSVHRIVVNSSAVT